MVWRCITLYRVSQLYQVVGHIDVIQYIQILSESLMGTLKDHCIKKWDIYFQQDNNLKYTLIATYTWFTSKQVDMLPWVACSPDMNIIKHVQSHLDCLVHTCKVLPHNADEMWVTLQKEWANIFPDFIQKLYNSMPHHIAALREAKSSYTKY